MANPPIIGYNFYLDGARVNTEPVGDEYVIDGLLTGSSHTVTSSVVDAAGYESAQSPPITVSTLSRPPHFPLPQADRDAIDAMVSSNLHAPGTVVAISSPRGDYTQVYGSGMSIDGHFRMASVTKTFTATAILMQIDAGNLSLDDTLGQFVGGVPNGNIITIEDLLMMRSGVYDYELDAALRIEYTLVQTINITPAQILAIIQDNGSLFYPGTAYYYTNSNYFLLGYVLQAITGRTWEDIVVNDIITPLELWETSIPSGTGLPAPADVGYGADPLSLIPIIGPIFPAIIERTAMSTGILWAAGELITTIGDLIKWGGEMRDGTLLSPEMQALRMSTFMSAPWAGNPAVASNFGPGTFGYGLGFEQLASWFGHDGSWVTFSCCVMFEPSTGTVIAVAENYQTVAPGPILAALTVHWFNIANYLYPLSLQLVYYLQPQTIPLDGIPSGEAYGALDVPFVVPKVPGSPPGDADGTTTIPHKVPYTVWPHPQSAALTGIPSTEAFGNPTVAVITNAIGNRTIPHTIPYTVWAPEFIYLAGIPSGETFGATVLLGGAIRPAVISPAGIPSAQSFGELTAQLDFTQFNQENVDLTDEPVPANCSGCYVTATGGGAPGGPGTAGGTTAGGYGGGGGAGIDRTFIPRDLLGDTYSMLQGGSGVQSGFSSGSVSLIAGAGSGQSGGVASVTGVTATTYNGGNGGWGSPGNPGIGGVTAVGNAGGGGGGGGGHAGGAVYNGGPGGSSAEGGGGGQGGIAGAGQTSGWPGASGIYPGGGGGGGGAGGLPPVGLGAYSGGPGGVGHILVEWV